MTAGEIAGALELLERLGTPLAIAGAVSGTMALIKSITTLRRTREFRAHMERERSHNKASLLGALRGCRDTISTMLGMRDADVYYRSLAAVSRMIQGPLLQHEAYVAHDARRLVPAVLTQLMDASTVGHRKSTVMLRVARRQVGNLIRNIDVPPVDPRHD